MEQIFGTLHHVGIGQECARAVVIFFYGLMLLRVSGRRTFAKWSALDIVMSILVGSTLSRALTANAPFAGSLAAVAALAVLHVVISYFAAKSERFSILVEGHPIPLVSHGQIDEARRVRHYISKADLAEALHQKNMEEVARPKRSCSNPTANST
ncbi:MAG TPA: YetF domain-containing protein [Rhizomicrobium sp.]|jgi:uncharacterized membrane protein YcaP (DUF421 family)